jgi:hypothetical protein
MIGRVLRDPNFPFADGKTGIKLFVVLCRSKTGDWIVARTTSQAGGRQWVVGCSLTEGYPSFYIPKGSAIFALDTWICLDYLVEFDAFELKENLKKGAIEDRGEIDVKLLCEILECAYKAEDISQAQADAIRDTMATSCN